MSQNCVCKSCPPGALKQHKSDTAVVFWQLNWGFAHVLGVPPSTLDPEPRSSWAPPKANLEIDRREGIEEAMIFAIAARPAPRADRGASLYYFSSAQKGHAGHRHDRPDGALQRDPHMEGLEVDFSHWIEERDH